MSMQLILGSWPPLVRDSRSAIGRLPGVVSPDTFDLYCDSDDNRYRRKIAASRHFLIFPSILKLLYRAQPLGQR
jgi:hypothetical protein